MFSRFVILSVAKKKELCAERRVNSLVSQAKICSCGQQQRESRQPSRTRQLSHPLLKPTGIFFLLLIYVPAGTTVGHILSCVCSSERFGFKMSIQSLANRLCSTADVGFHLRDHRILVLSTSSTVLLLRMLPPHPAERVIVAVCTCLSQLGGSEN